MRATNLGFKRARRLRSEMTPPEVLLWLKLRGRSDQRPVFRRQHPFGPFILDFYCPAARLVIEIDGHLHGSDDQSARDERRDLYLGAKGLEVVRISAADVMADVDATADGIMRMAIGLAMGQGR
jgi:very-short-patch-repair endonuclease